MANMFMRVGLSADGEQVVLQLEQEKSPLGHITFDAPTTEKHIQDVARARAQLPEGVTPDLDPGSRLEAIHDPRWRTLHVPEHGIAALALRHPGLGWLSFGFPPHEARALGQSLLSIAEQLEADKKP